MFQGIIQNNDISKVTINGKTITCKGKNVSVINGKVIVDGKTIYPDNDEKIFTGNIDVNIYGNINNLECDGSVIVNGDVRKNIDCGGSCEVNGDVGGNIDCGGSCSCGNVNGNIDAGGSVSCRK